MCTSALLHRLIWIIRGSFSVSAVGFHHRNAPRSCFCSLTRHLSNKPRSHPAAAKSHLTTLLSSWLTLCWLLSRLSALALLERQIHPFSLFGFRKYQAVPISVSCSSALLLVQRPPNLGLCAASSTLKAILRYCIVCFHSIILNGGLRNRSRESMNILLNFKKRKQLQKNS